MKIKISPWISTRTHISQSGKSVSLIFDIKTRVYFLLKGIYSDLWYKIVETQDYNKIKEFCYKNGIVEQLTQFISELQYKNIITTDENFSQPEIFFLKNAISPESENSVYFFQKWLLSLRGYICSLHMELNYKCNLHCKHCYNHKNMNEYFINFEQAKNIIDNAFDMGVYTVALSGGECTINKDFLKIAKYIRQKQLELHILTNGQAFYDNPELLDEIIKIYPVRVKLSLYSMDPDVHDYITGVKGSHHKTLTVINKLHDSGIRTVIATPLLSYNKDTYMDVYKYSKKIGVRFNFGHLFVNNPENNNIDARIDLESIEKFYIETFDFKHIRNFTKNDCQVCEAGNDRICVTPKLDVTPCIGVDYPLGNLNTMSFEELKNKVLPDFRKMYIKSNLKECFTQDYCKYCNYCPDTAAFNHSFMKKSEIHCQDAQAYQKALLFHKKAGNI